MLRKERAVGPRKDATVFAPARLDGIPGGLAADGRTLRDHRPSGWRKHRIYRARLPGFEARYAVVTVATP
jgi:hypothetical protein